MFAGKGIMSMRLFYFSLLEIVVYYRRFRIRRHILPGTGNKRP
jgi:hypothetical protein